MRDNCSTNEKEFDSRTIEEGRCKVYDLLGIASELNEAQLSLGIRQLAAQFQHVKKSVRKNIFCEVKKDSDFIEEVKLICFLVENCLWSEFFRFIIYLSSA